MRMDKLKEMPHWSYSAMQCYLSCPLKYKFRYIDNASVERTNACFPFGRAFHAALSERARIGSFMSEREVCDVFEDFFKAETDAAENLVFKASETYDSLLQTDPVNNVIPRGGSHDKSSGAKMVGSLHHS